jgi:putative transcription antitermination factor YqgF
MKILGIDYGRRKLGLAMSEGYLSEPWKVLRVEHLDEALKKITQIIKDEKIEKVVIGVSEGAMGRESKDFGMNLQQELEIQVDTHDETLSTQDATRLAIEAGMGRKKRNEMEDAFAASIILQDYLDSK